jgi:HD-GYP domain-containing protein (c-di-GMP phosphodiesterase class II)
MSIASQRQLPPSTGDRPGAYRAITVNTLRLGSILPFVLHTQIEGEYLIYRRENLAFTETQRQALLENGLDTLYIAPDQVPLYWEYLTKNIQQILDDEQLPIEDRSAALYQSAEEICRRIVDNPVDSENVQLAQDVVAESIRFQSGGKSALHALMQQMAQEPNLHTHSLHVCQYGLALARQLHALTGDDLEAFGMGLLLLDIGMLQIPDSLAFKDGPLSFDEWSLVKRHPALGLESLDGLAGVPDLAREVIFGHHERVDGSGYPQGLRGTELPLVLRIAGVVETFTSLTSARNFREAMSTYEALREMQTDLLDTLDTRVLEAFIGLLGK